MALLPDISREAKIVSGKELKTLDSNYQSNSGLLAPAATNISYDMNGSFDQTEIKEDHTTSKLVTSRKKQPSLSATIQKFPNLIFNDNNKSSAYQRLARSSDFLNAKNSPLATRLIYNWKPVERATTKIVQAKVKIFKPSKRIDMPNRPMSPYKLKVDYETKEPHFHNEKRTLEMKRMQYLKEHTNWSIYPYGAIEERESYNKNIRETLKEQMEQKDRYTKKEFEKRILEYKMVAQQDENSINEDKRKKFERYNYLKKFTEENKQSMEDRWMNGYILKRHEWQQESQLLEQDPINWSKTLK